MIARALGLLAACATLGCANAWGGTVEASASSRIELVPDWDGSARVRAGHFVSLVAHAGPRWTFDVSGAGRFGGSWHPAAFDLYRAAIHYDRGNFGLVLGRMVEPGPNARLRLDGALVRLGGGGVQGRIWVGHSWHPELAWNDVPQLAVGGDISLRPAGGLGAVSAGALLRGAGGVPDGRVWLLADGRDLRGAFWLVSLEAALGPSRGPALVPFRGAAALRAPLGAHVELAADLRWEGLPPVTIPLGASSPLDRISSRGYGVTRGSAAVHFGPLHVTVEGGPTFRPEGGWHVGGIGKAMIGIERGHGLRVSVGGIGAAIGSTWIAGGVAESRLDLGPLHSELAGSGLRMRGLDHHVGWVGDGRARLGVTVPVPKLRLASALRVYGEVAAGADRLLTPWVRGGLGIELRAAGPVGRRKS